ncbi:hypothetical protein QYE76_059187 [Lolium multiflorum]|uniref:C2H2-type domain-containing protein n=1 Tax=Lolium multiflorum TaxID=4521 RepID=A0AAD8VFQ1_LOLMU|nr:hypothetical protein QYE76_059187 [Lolium multiflorum]
MYRYYGAPAVAFWKGGQPEHHFLAGEASEAQAAPAATDAFTVPDWISWFAASDPQRDAQVAAMEAPNGMAPAAAATAMHHAEFNAHFSHPLPRNALGKFVKKIPKVVQPVTCQVCNMQLDSVNNIRSHITGNKHKKNLEKLQDSITPKVAEIPDGAVAVHQTGRKRLEKPVPCELCKLQLTSINEFRSHVAGKKHKMNLEMLQDSTTPKLAEPPNGAVGESTEAAAAVTDGMIPAVQPMENKSPAATPEDLEAGAPEGELKVCTVSNVVKEIPKVVQPVTCEVCKTQLGSVNNMRSHETGKKHKKNLEKLQDSITPKVAETPDGAVAVHRTGRKRLEKPVPCELCKLQLTSIHDIRSHAAGKKHKMNLEMLQDSTTPKLAEPPNGAVGESTEAAAAVTDGVMPAVQPMENKSPAATAEDLEAGAPEGELKVCTVSNVVMKIPKVVQPVTCEGCKMQLGSVNNIRSHETGKKHKKNLEKLQDSTNSKLAEPPNGAVGESTEPAAAVTDGVMPAVHPRKRKRPAATPEDLEAKKRRAIKGGVA